MKDSIGPSLHIGVFGCVDGEAIVNGKSLKTSVPLFVLLTIFRNRYCCRVLRYSVCIPVLVGNVFHLMTSGDLTLDLTLKMPEVL